MGLLGTVVAATLALVGAPDPVRVPPGLAATLFLPGYALSIALFPDAEFDTPERLALAFGLSLALIVVAAILLLWVPWRSEAVPVVGIAGMTVAFCLVAEWRRRTPGHRSSGQAAIPRDRSALPTVLAGVPFPVFTLVVIFALAGGGIVWLCTLLLARPSSTPLASRACRRTTRSQDSGRQTVSAQHRHREWRSKADDLSCGCHSRRRDGRDDRTDGA